MQLSSTVIVTIALLIASTASASVGNSQQIVGQTILQRQSLTEESSLNTPSELTRLKKSAYGGGSVGGVPCPKSYLFSCQPNIAPVPCASGGHAGAYSSPIPTYALPLTNSGAPVRNWHYYYY